MGRHKTAAEIIAKQKALIIEQLSLGKSLLSIQKENKAYHKKIREGSITKNTDVDIPELPARAIIYEWLNDAHPCFDRNFLNNYKEARENSADLNLEEIEEIADKVLRGIYDPAAARVAIFAKQWVAGKKNPRKYKDGLDITSDGKKITQQVTVFKLPDNNRDTEI